MSRLDATWRRRAALAGGSVIAALVVAAAIAASLDDPGGAQSAGPVPSLPEDSSSGSSTRLPAAPAASSSKPVTQTSLGVFEPIRGWIVYPVGNRLRAVNPADPTERRTVTLPAGLDAFLGGGPDGGNRPSPAGWSADGTKLGLSSEYSGDSFVMNADGSLTRVLAAQGGCCLFVTQPWLSPDGTTALTGIHRGGLQYADLVNPGGGRQDLDPALPRDRTGWLAGAWAPDGKRVAFVTVNRPLEGSVPRVHVADFSSGRHRALAPLAVGHVRHLAWSPDGSQLLAVGGKPLPRGYGSNPLVYPQPTSLYLLATDGSGVRKIASGYYLATAWSPDGRQIAAIEYLRDRRLVVMDAKGTHQRTLVELPSGELFTGLAWHPLPDRS